MRGFYDYAQANIMLCKLTDEKNPKTGVMEQKLKYIDGNADCQATETIAKRGGLTKGTYLVFYQVQFDAEQLQKIVLSVHTERNVNFRKISNEGFGEERFMELTNLLGWDLDDSVLEGAN